MQQHQQQQQNGITQTNGIQQISIQPKPILIGTQQTSSQAQTQSLESRPMMTMVSIGGNNVSSTNSSPMLQGQTGSSPTATLNAMSNSLSAPPHLTLQPQPNPLAAMTTLSYTASPSMTLNKDDKQNSQQAKAEEQQKLNEQLQQSAAAASLVSLSNSSSAVSISSANITAQTTTSNGNASGFTNGISSTALTTSNSTASPKTTTAQKDNKVPGKNKGELLLLINRTQGKIQRNCIFRKFKI